MSARICALAFLASCLAGASILAAPEEPQKADPVIFRYKDQPFTAADLTSVSYHDYQQFLEETRRIYDPAKHRPPSVGLRPGGDIWKTGRPDDFEGFYKLQLNGVIELFVSDQVFQEIRKKFGKEIVIKYIDETAVEQYITKYVEVEQAYSRASLDAFARAQDVKSFMGLSEKAFPAGILEVTYDQGYKLMTSARPYCYLNHACFPMAKDGQVAPWMRWELEIPLTEYYVQALLEQDTQKYSAMLKQKCMIEGINPINDTRTSPPGFLYDVAEEAILKPIYAEVVRSLRLSEGYSLPPMSRLVVSSRGSGICKSILGRPLPRVVLVENQLESK